MKNQNDMMGFVWLLNTVGTSMAPLQGLCAEFLNKQDEFNKLKQEIGKNEAMSQYMEKEIKLSIDCLIDLNEKLTEVINVLQKGDV
ncbi:MAG: hypothetical protein FWE24_06850 [Defluviitaleaceae bacterium]|nr:hypothetical protein [Defluviitaleaceae bacterium]